MQKRFEAIQEQAKILDRHVEGMARVIASAEIAREVATKNVTPEQRKIMLESRTMAIAGTSERDLAGKTDMSNLVKLQKDLNRLRGEEANLNNNAREQLTRDITRKTEDNALTKKEEEAKQKLANAVAQSNLEIAKATDAFDQLTKAAAINANKGLTVAIAGLESFANNAKTSLNSMFKAIREGTLTIENFKQGFQDFIFNIIDDIQASITEEFIVKPLKDFFANQLKSIFNIGGGAKASPAATTATATTKMATAIPGAITKQTTDICACLRELDGESQFGVRGEREGESNIRDSLASGEIPNGEQENEIIDQRLSSALTTGETIDLAELQSMLGR